ncbi:glycosyltransferase [Secundilactobacillus similis]|nr:glycosyltransferase [Secundilactobacillus similis]
MNFFLNRAMGIGNSGVEHAQFYRANRFDQAQLPYRFVFTELIPELHEAMAKWQLTTQQVINMWEYFVFGDDYLTTGKTPTGTTRKLTVIDSTNTHRKRELVTSSGMRIVDHLVKYPAADRKMLLVGTARVELLDDTTGERRVMYDVYQDEHQNHRIRNIHLFNEQGAHRFFRNEVLLQRYFLNVLDQAFGGHSNFIIDRDENTEAALFNHQPTGSHLIEMIHADHLSDRNDPKHPLWNNYYEYLLTHLNRVDRVVVATELQRQDLLVDFPDDTEKFVTIPVGGIRDEVAEHATATLGKPLKLVSMSRLAAEKHLDLAIKAVAQVHDAGTPVELDIYGQGGELNKLTQVIKDCHASEYIRMMGHTNESAKIYPRYDAFISASYSEGFGLTYIEALNAMLPVITFAARFGALELIQDGKNGFLQPFKRDDNDGNVAQLVTGINRLLAADYSALHAETRASIQNYRDHVIADQWKELMHAL